MFDNYEKFKKDVYALTKIDLSIFLQSMSLSFTVIRISGS